MVVHGGWPTDVIETISGISDGAEKRAYDFN